MVLIDEVKLHIKAGDGGDGVVRWRREKFKPKAGPGGGDGGRGGDVFAEAVADLAYLEYYKFKKEFSAENGQDGGNFGKKGRDGKDLILYFPRGSVLINEKTGQIFDLNEVGKKVRILRGGSGGYGNEHFKSSTNTTPYEWTPGKKGEEAVFSVELRMFADIGLVGLPSAGKSSLLNALTNAKSKVGAYHFTTLDPHLGSMDGVIIADIPGIIKGASEGKGLGLKFLKHITRTNLLLYILSLESDNLFEDYRIVKNEILSYGNGLEKKKSFILLSKKDLVSQNELEEKRISFEKKSKEKVLFAYSIENQQDIETLKKLLKEKILENKKGD